MRVLVERERVLGALHAAVDEARAGRGSMVLITGEAGLGKTSVVRAFVGAVAARVLVGSCDGLLTPRMFGALREAMAGSGGRLEAALDDADREAVFDVALADLAAEAPTVLVVEDLHWADEATVDLIGYLTRRIEALPVVLVGTMREEVEENRPVRRRTCGSVSTSEVRLRHLPLVPLTPAGVAQLAAGSGWDAAELHALTGGNPFHVTEMLAAPGGQAVPATIVRAAAGRVQRLGARCRQAIEQLAVLSGTVDFDLIDGLLGKQAEVLAEAEQHGILEVRRDGLAFRHELVRRGVEASLPHLRRRALHLAVLTVLAGRQQPDLARLVHHAVGAGNHGATAHYALLAGREAAAAGTHDAALAHFTTATAHADALGDADRARLADDHAGELSHAHRFAEAIHVGETAVRRYAELGDPIALGQARARLSRHYYLAGDTALAITTARQAVELLEPTEAVPAKACAVTYHGAVQALTGHPDAATTLRRAETLAQQADRVDLAGLIMTYQSIALPDLDLDGRIAVLTDSLELARTHGHHEHVARAYTTLAELLYQHGRLDELQRCLTDGLAFADGRGLRSHAYHLTVHRGLLHLRRGDWTCADNDLSACADGAAGTGVLASYVQPAHARLLARRGHPAAGDLLHRAWRRGRRQQSLAVLGLSGTALAEWAWLTNQPTVAAAVRHTWRHHAHRPGAAPLWAEILRYCARAGLPAEPFDGCPEPWVAGLRGDWQSAATAWERIGDPYEQALALADSGVIEPTLQALRTLDDLGATAAATQVRHQLRTLGLRTIPRRPSTHTRTHPAGLTARQADVLDLLADGLTNAEIATRLVVSVRTVDHHVSAILTRLGVTSRHEAAATLRNRQTRTAG
ncbi:MAG TPA: AAA family ATPase [Actinophytocola sp.]|uniref:ATP-binding protein n=1 Tax=Actinophytocola sp. TaxID=1872138 RepID=UPI002DB79118|nr:AAA family ATPase [Actinophytocola sp.]HEU5469392.1 AAA family ATPase [Actinophytocola sp.]